MFSIAFIILFIMSVVWKLMKTEFFKWINEINKYFIECIMQRESGFG